MERQIAGAGEIKQAIAQEFGDKVRAEVVDDCVEVQTYKGEMPSASILFYVEDGDWTATASTDEMTAGLPGDRPFPDIDTVASDIHWAVCSVQDVLNA